MSTWGKPYGPPMYRFPDGLRVHLHRGPRNHCRFYDDQGVQVGPEQSNVAPAIAWAMHNNLKEYPPNACTRIGASVGSRP